MSDLAKSAEAQQVILNLGCPIRQLQEIFAANLSIFPNTVLEGCYENIYKLFEFPADSWKVNFTIQEKKSDREA